MIRHRDDAFPVCITGEGWVSEYSNNIESLGAKFAERSILLKTRILTLSIKVG